MNDIEYPLQTIQFGDFTEEELTTSFKRPRKRTWRRLLSELDVSNITTLKKKDQDHLLHTQIPITPSPSSTNSWFLFGSFTDKECMELQNGFEISFSSPTPSNPFRKRCFRCGYNSHTIDNCIARRHRSGIYIGYPGHHSTNYNNFTPPTSIHHTPTTSFDLHKDPPRDFVFNISELKDWMLHDYEYRLNAYLDTLQDSSSKCDAERQFKEHAEYQKINEYLYLDYLTTNLLFERQSSNYFQNLLKQPM